MCMLSTLPPTMTPHKTENDWNAMIADDKRLGEILSPRSCGFTPKQVVIDFDDFFFQSRRNANPRQKLLLSLIRAIHFLFVVRAFFPIEFVGLPMLSFFVTNLITSFPLSLIKVRQVIQQWLVARRLKPRKQTFYITKSEFHVTLKIIKKNRRWAIFFDVYYFEDFFTWTLRCTQRDNSWEGERSIEFQNANSGLAPCWINAFNNKLRKFFYTHIEAHGIQRELVGALRSVAGRSGCRMARDKQNRKNAPT